MPLLSVRSCRSRNSFDVRGTTWRCQIVDKHFENLAPKHLEAKFCKIDAEKVCRLIAIVFNSLVPFPCGTLKNMDFAHHCSH